MSLPPRFDYCNCLLTVCAASFHTSSSCQGQEQGAACILLKVGTSNTQGYQDCILSIHHPQALDFHANLEIAPILYAFCSCAVSLAKHTSGFSPWIFCGQILPITVIQGYSESCLKMFVFISNCLTPWLYYIFFNFKIFLLVPCCFKLIFMNHLAPLLIFPFTFITDFMGWGWRCP